MYFVFRLVLVLCQEQVLRNSVIYKYLEVPLPI